MLLRNLFLVNIIIFVNLFYCCSQSKKTNIKISEDYILRKIAERTKAKKDRNFVIADQIRKDLLEQGIVIEDQQDKTIWKLK